jgi:nijmegen breakage syndrome protein 1
MLNGSSFTWVPTSLSITLPGKDIKADPFTPLLESLGPLDIKVLREYERGYTTHLLARKRNTQKGLQALIDGKSIVNFDTYVTAIKAVTTPGENGKALLEEDFSRFPDPLEYLPPKGDEPTTRGDTAYAPNPARRDMFEGYTFIFTDQRQFDNLIAPITMGCGKALYREIEPDKTTVLDFVRYVKDVAGEKGLGEFEDGSEGKGVVVVKFNPTKGPRHDWYAKFCTEVALSLDHRLIEQNEFLDAILGADPSVLRRPLEPEPSGYTIAHETNSKYFVQCCFTDPNWDFQLSPQCHKLPRPHNLLPPPRSKKLLRPVLLDEVDLGARRLLDSRGLTMRMISVPP